ncbi:MAG TPA: substrate-binding domain-containing protein [Candidatus Limivivens merdigallinarum]|uniref:Substrate-binding domain-containing protein n=1 Tax=Candidatus Limivivens merdigallinarum TaxID=2840859 RepID=A0A9D0ZTH1_9FIRM|nr:substrate-binding domain-containing protein [Candidatus Limivivens merdigallinarum]
MKKKLVSLLMCAAMVSSMGLGVFAAEETEAAADNSDITIGSVIMNNSGEWFAEVIKGQEDAAADLGINFSMVSSDNEISKESDNVATFMAQGVDALVISPLAVDASVAAIETATKDAGIPVVTWNTTVNTDVTSHVGVVPAELGGNTGKYAAEYIKENFPDGCKIALIENSNYEIGIQRCEGFKAELQELIDDGTVEIVNEQDAELQEEGLDITEQILTANPDVQMIWCWNQTSLLGCAAALQNAGRSDIVLMGTDMSVELAKDMQGEDITLQAITTQMPYDMGYQAVENAVKAVKGEEVEAEIMIPTYTYTKDNMDEIQTYIDEHEDLVG